MDIYKLVEKYENRHQPWFDFEPIQSDYVFSEDGYEEVKNTKWGGQPGVSHHPEHCKAIAEALTGHKQSEETKRKRVESRKANNKYWHSDETRSKISKSNTGQSRKHTEETKRKISMNGVGMRGKSHSEETRRKIAEAQRLRHARRKQMG
jgi:hypothetical protein